MTKKSIKIQRNEDLDARPIALLVQQANQYSSTVYIELENKKINAKSIMGMMSLKLVNGIELTIVADGADEEEAVRGVEQFLVSNS